MSCLPLVDLGEEDELNGTESAVMEVTTNSGSHEVHKAQVTKWGILRSIRGGQNGCFLPFSLVFFFMFDTLRLNSFLSIAIFSWIYIQIIII